MTIEERLERIERLLLAGQPVAEYYSIRQAAEVVGLSRDHVSRRACQRSCLRKCRHQAPPTYRIARTDLLAWVEAEIRPAAPVSKEGVSYSRLAAATGILTHPIRDIIIGQVLVAFCRGGDDVTASAMTTCCSLPCTNSSVIRVCRVL